MPDGLIVFPESTLTKASTAFDWWRAEAQRCGIRLAVAFAEQIQMRYVDGNALTFTGGRQIDTPRFAVMRGYFRDISCHFERLGIPAVNRWISMQESADKILTHQALTAAGLPTPVTVYPASALSYDDACEAIGARRFVIKPIEGSCGVNVFLVNSCDEYDHAIKSAGSDALIQHYVRSSSGRDLRVWTVGEHTVGCVMRHSSSSFRSNYAQGGSASVCALSDDAARMAVAAARCLGLEFAGVDLLFTPEGGFTVCEVNGNAGFRTLSAVDRHSPILRRLFEYITDRYVQ